MTTSQYSPFNTYLLVCVTCTSVMPYASFGREKQPDKKSRPFAGAMRNPAGVSHVSYSCSPLISSNIPRYVTTLVSRRLLLWYPLNTYPSSFQIFHNFSYRKYHHASDSKPYKRIKQESCNNTFRGCYGNIMSILYWPTATIMSNVTVSSR